MPTSSNPVVKFEALSIKGITIDPTKIISLDIFESLGSLGITGKLVFQDFSDLKEVGNIFAGDRIVIVFGRQEDPSLNLEYVITESSGDRYKLNSIHNEISFRFCSPWLLEAATRKRSRPFSNKRIDEIVTELVEECGGEMLNSITTKQTLERFVTPYWTPLETIRYLMTFAMNEDNLGGYACWSDIESDRVNFVPVGLLMEGQYGEAGLDMEMNSIIQHSAKNVYSAIPERSYDIMKYADIGMGNSKIVKFNYDKSEFMNTDETVENYAGLDEAGGVKHPHLSSKMALNKKYLGKLFRNVKSSTLFPNTDTLIEDVEGGTIAQDLINGRLRTKYSLMFADMFKLVISTPGENFAKRAGRLIYIDLPASDDGGTQKSKHHSGTYLIRDIRHTVQGMQYGNSLTLIADGFKDTERLDMIEWEVDNLGYDTAADGDEFDADEFPFVSEEVIDDVVQEDGITTGIPTEAGF